MKSPDPSTSRSSSHRSQICASVICSLRCACVSVHRTVADVFDDDHHDDDN